MEKFIPLKVKDLVKHKRPLVDVHSSTTVQETIDLLAREKLMSLPVHGQPGHWLASGGTEVIVDDKQYIGKFNYFSSHLLSEFILY